MLAAPVKIVYGYGPDVGVSKSKLNKPLPGP